MNDHQLDLALGGIGERRTRVTTPPALRSRIRAIPLESQPAGHWLGRFRSMFSATKLAFAGMIVALVGAFLLSGMLPTSNQSVTPGAEASPASVEPVTPVSGRFGLDDSVEVVPETSALAGDGERQVLIWPHVPVEMTDTRLEGDLVLRETIDTYPEVRYQRIEMRIETPDGAWQVEPISNIVDEPAGGESFGDTVWVGEGGYEGLRLIAGLEGFGFGFDVEGYIVAADAPPATESSEASD